MTDFAAMDRKQLNAYARKNGISTLRRSKQDVLKDVLKIARPAPVPIAPNQLEERNPLPPPVSSPSRDAQIETFAGTDEGPLPLRQAGSRPALSDLLQPSANAPMLTCDGSGFIIARNTRDSLHIIDRPTGAVIAIVYGLDAIRNGKRARLNMEHHAQLLVGQAARAVAC